MEYGIEHNPDNWHLYYDLGFVYYTELKDYKSAAAVFEKGSNLPNAHPYMKIMAAQMAAHAGRPGDGSDVVERYVRDCV